MFMTRLGCVFWLLVVIDAVFVDCERLVPPIRAIIRGFNDRVEFISAEICKKHLNTGTTPGAAADAFLKQMTVYEGDDAGQLISSKLGGTGTEMYNIIPMNCFINRGLWRPLVEMPIYQNVSAGSVVKLSISIVYDNATSTRPSKLNFSLDIKMSTGDPESVVKNSTLDNPVPTIPCHHIMVPQSQIVKNETKITTVTTTTVTNTTIFAPHPLCSTNGTNPTYCQNVDFFLKPVASSIPRVESVVTPVPDKFSDATTTTSTSPTSLLKTTTTRRHRKAKRVNRYHQKANNQTKAIVKPSTTTSTTDESFNAFVPSTSTEGNYGGKRCFSRDWMIAAQVSICINAA